MIRDTQPQEVSPNPPYSGGALTPPQDLCSCEIKLTIVLTAAAFAVCLIGSFIYCGHMEIVWSSVGSISHNTALCLMLTGLFISFIGLILLITTCSRQSYNRPIPRTSVLNSDSQPLITQ